MGLREDKRQRLRETIIENSIALFRERGFESVSVREIARRSDISEATFFNHFPTKDAVLSRWACAELERAFARAAEPARNLRATLRDVAARLDAGVAQDPRISELAWGRARIAHLGVPAPAVPLIEAAQAAGELRRDVPASALARLFAAIAATTIAASLQASAPVPKSASGPSPLGADLRQALDLVLDGSRRRHERIRPGAATSAATARSKRPDP